MTTDVTSAEGIAAEMKGIVSSGTIVRLNEPLAKRTTLRVGGPADVWIEPAEEKDLIAVLEFCRGNGIPWMVLGKGSNLLVRDGGIRGVVLFLGQPVFSKIEVRERNLHCGAGARLRAVAYEAKGAGLTGLEFLEGIPGSIGGALRMNAGAMGSAIFDQVERFRYLDHTGVIREATPREVKVEYRSCPTLRESVALSAILRGDPAPREAIEARMAQCSAKRWNSQPAAPSAGCIFKNHVTVPAGKLVDELGLKGRRIGGAMISDVHGNFIVNDRNASARDILQLIDLVKETARERRGIELQTEVQIVGED